MKISSKRKLWDDFINPLIKLPYLHGLELLAAYMMELILSLHFCMGMLSRPRMEETWLGKLSNANLFKKNRNISALTFTDNVSMGLPASLPVFIYLSLPVYLVCMLIFSFIFSSFCSCYLFTCSFVISW